MDHLADIITLATAITQLAVTLTGYRRRPRKR